ncbi:hypothetical protein M0R36_11255 [bacterium]|nr:hypothetical protein [bacterium]
MKTLSGFNLKPLKSFPKKSNPFLHDLDNMGTNVGNNLVVMFRSLENEEAEFLIIVNKVTGERILVKPTM